MSSARRCARGARWRCCYPDESLDTTTAAKHALTRSRDCYRSWSAVSSSTTRYSWSARPADPRPAGRSSACRTPIVCSRSSRARVRPQELGSPDGESGAQLARLHGCDLVGYDVARGSGDLEGWIAALAPTSTFTISRHGESPGRRGAHGASPGRAVGRRGARGRRRTRLRTSGRTRRAARRGHGRRPRRGSEHGRLHRRAARLRARRRLRWTPCCYEEWVRRNPINDYTVPRAALIKGHKAEAMLERVFGDVRLEELARIVLLRERRPTSQLSRDRSRRIDDARRGCEHLTAADRAAAAPRRATADRRLAAG